MPLRLLLDSVEVLELTLDFTADVVVAVLELELVFTADEMDELELESAFAAVVIVVVDAMLELLDVLFAEAGTLEGTAVGVVEVRVIDEVSEETTVTVDVALEEVWIELVVDNIEDVLEEVVQSPPGTLRDCPMSNTSQFTSGFEALRASKVTPKVFEILYPSSPGTTA